MTTESYQCLCGYRYGLNLGAWGCPNCEGDRGPATTVKNASQRLYGCHNRQAMRKHYIAQDGQVYLRDFKAIATASTVVEHKNTTDCQYTRQAPADPGCQGCKHQGKTP